MKIASFASVKADAWIWSAIALMLASAYSIVRWLGLVGAISGWIGLAAHEAQVPKLQFQAKLWLAVAVVLPFVAATLLSAARKKSNVNGSSDVGTPLTYGVEPRLVKRMEAVVGYLGRLGLAISGSLLFVVLLLLLSLLLRKLGIRSSQT